MKGNEFVASGSYVDLTEYSSNLDEMWFVPAQIDGVADGHALVVKFKNGVHYAYGGVTPPLWQYILDGKEAKSTGKKFSIGAAFTEEVIRKKDLYPYVKLTPEMVKDLIG